MGRTAIAVGLILGLVVAVNTPSSASDCTKLIQQVNDEAGNRLDDAGYNARQLADQAEQLDKQGKTAECQVKAQEAMKQLGI